MNQKYHSDYTRQWRLDNPESTRLSKRKYRLKAFGLTVEEWDALFETQGGVCAICREPETETRLGKLKELAVDHCHASGRVRGLLCGRCNKGLGCFKDQPELMQRAAVYVS